MPSKEYIDKKRDELWPLRKYMKFGYVKKSQDLSSKKWCELVKDERRLACLFYI